MSDRVCSKSPACGRSICAGVCTCPDDCNDGVSRGLGDTAEKLIRRSGIKAVVEAIKGSECVPCTERQEAMNKAIPYQQGNK